MSEHHLGHFVRRFLLEEVMAERNLSPNTQKRYRDAIRLLFRFIAERHSTDPTCVTVEQVDAEMVRSFLIHLERERGNSIATRNQRLTTLHSLFRFIGRLVPELIEHATHVQAISTRRTITPAMPYLEKYEIDAPLASPNRRRPQGQRDYALLLFLYNTGARATEAAQVTVGDLNLDASPSVRFLGKGRKVRWCPLWPHTASILADLLGTRVAGPEDDPAFRNVRGQPITRFGIHTLVARSVVKAAAAAPSLRDKTVSPHTIRHTTAVHLLRTGVDINTIRAWLGHVSLETTNRYAEIDLEMKAKALQTCAVTGQADVPGCTHSGQADSELMSFLSSL